MNPTLRHRDGYGATTPTLRPFVERLQRALERAGYNVEVDGLFGQGTRREVIKYQRQNGLTTDGIVGPATWRALTPFLRAPDRPPSYENISGFETFHGDLNWVHEQEGHAGRAYWPGGRSGVTLDPGFDLGHQSLDTTRELYSDVLTQSQVRAIRPVIGLKGLVAKAALNGSAVLQGIRVSRSRAGRIMPHIAVDYWKPVATKFRRVAEDETPGSVQTAMLSLSYNRGPHNSSLTVLRAPLSRGNWLRVAKLIGSMQQDHELRGIRIRRRREADLIRHDLEFD